jgi:hypothetical protein
MSWDKQASLDRIQKRWDARDRDISVTKLTREMNLENVTLHNGRLIRGAHVYATVSASGGLKALESTEDAQSAIQRLAIWQSEVGRIANAFDVPLIALQGGRVHLLVYRPVEDDEAIARKAVLLARAITYMTRDAFNPLFDEALRLSARAAADLGQTVATRGGTRGDSELLFLGAAANRPAKLLSTSRLVTTNRLLDAVGDQLDYTAIEADDDDASIVKIGLDIVEEEAAADGIDWSVDTSAERLADDLEKWPVARFGVSGAKELIHPTQLSRSDSKLVQAAAILMDIDGFSDYVDESEEDEVKRDAILTLDAIRQEMRCVLKSDYNGVRIQYQGDNMIGFVHLPEDDDEKIATAAADIAAGMQGSMSSTLPEIVPDAGRLDIAVGVALNQTIVSCLGPHRRRSALILGPAATEAENIQMRLDGNQTGLDKCAYDALPDNIKELYEWSAMAKAWVTENTDAAKLARVRESLGSRGPRAVSRNDRLGRFSIGGTATTTQDSERVRPLRPYAE